MSAIVNKTDPVTAIANSHPRPPELPSVSRFYSGGFHWYVPRYLKHHFNAVRVAMPTALELRDDAPVICFANHPGWWDPLIAFLLNNLYFLGKTPYTPIDQAALEQYPVFRKLGFYGIELKSLDGAKQFLAVTRKLLRQPTSAIWMTPGGKFADVRERTKFQPGLAHIAATITGVTLLPLALEYTFWEERTPEALVEFGEPMLTGADGRSKAAWHATLEQSLAAAQASLALKAISRDPNQFDTVLAGSAGVGGWYDLLRRTKSLFTRNAFDPRHRRK